VGITKASSSNVRMKNAKMKAIATDSMVSRIEAAVGACLSQNEGGGGVENGGTPEDGRRGAFFLLLDMKKNSSFPPANRRGLIV